MPLNNPQDAEIAVRQWLSSRYPDAQGVRFSSVMQSGNVWIADVSFSQSGTFQNLRVQVDSASLSIVGYQNIQGTSSFSNLGNLLIVISLIISAVVSLVLIVYGFSVLFLAILSPIVIIGIGAIVVGFFDIFITIEINRIRTLVESGNYRAAPDRLSLTFIIPAAIFEFLVTGLLLLLAREELKSTPH